MYHISLHIIAVTKLKNQRPLPLELGDFIDLKFMQCCLLYSNSYSSAGYIHAVL